MKEDTETITLAPCHNALYKTICRTPSRQWDAAHQNKARKIQEGRKKVQKNK
jgi:hypothetical protein